jgi:hypothetical protein
MPPHLLLRILEHPLRRAKQRQLIIQPEVTPQLDSFHAADGRIQCCADRCAGLHARRKGNLPLWIRICHIFVFQAEKSTAVVSPASPLSCAATTATRMHPESRSASTRRTSPALNPPPAICLQLSLLSSYHQKMIQNDGYLLLEMSLVRIMRSMYKDL